MLTVTTPAEDTSLLTTDELREAVGVAAGAENTAMVALGRRVAACIARACNVAPGGTLPPTLRVETLTEVFRRRSPMLSRRPVTEIISVTEAGTLLTGTQYELDSLDGILVRLADDTPVQWSCTGKITVVYKAGWEIVPADLKLAAMKLAQTFWVDASRDASLKREVIPGVIEREWWVAPASDILLPAEVSDLLAPYTNYWMA